MHPQSTDFIDYDEIRAALRSANLSGGCPHERLQVNNLIGADLAGWVRVRETPKSRIRRYLRSLLN